MKKIFLILMLIISANVVNAANAEKVVDNPGYMKSIGFMGVYGFSPDYDKKMYKDGLIGGGLFLYFTPINTLYGNLLIGVGSSYDQSNYRSDRSNQKRVEGWITSIPLQASIGYSTSSNFVNAWAGVSYSYNMIDINYNKVITNDGIVHSTSAREYAKLSGIDVFIGAEYILTKNGLLGIYFEARYSFVENMVVDKYIREANVNVKETFSPFVMRYGLGLTLHF